MVTSVVEMAAARENLASLLALLDLEGHRFELSLDDEEWKVSLECVAPGGWLSVNVRIPRADLRDAADDPRVEQRLLNDLGARLSGCRREESNQ